jgi:hypothetical protein
LTNRFLPIFTFGMCSRCFPFEGVRAVEVARGEFADERRSTDEESDGPKIEQVSGALRASVRSGFKPITTGDVQPQSNMSYEEVNGIRR